MSPSVYHDNEKMLAVNLRKNELNNVGIKPIYMLYSEALAVPKEYNLRWYLGLVKYHRVGYYLV